MSPKPELDVVFFIADAYRSDALMLEPPAGGRSSLAERLATWIRFDRYFAAAPWTLPAVTSLFTGVTVAHHQHYEHTPATWTSLLDGIGSGWRKVGIVNNSVLTRTSGIAAAFDEYEHVREHHEPFDRAHEFLDARDPDAPPYFMLLHSNLTHDYHLPSSQPYYEHFFPDHRDWFHLAYRILSWPDPTPSQVATVRRLYDSCALELNERFQALLDRIDLDRTIVVFIADHGEGLDPARARVHHGGRLHNDVIRVPFIVHLPAQVDSETRAALADAARVPVGSADVFPTLLGLLGRPIPGGIDGVDGIDGIDGDDLVSLGAHPRDRTVESEDARYLYLRNRFRMNTNSKGKNMTRRNRARNRFLRATVAKQHRIVAYVEWPWKMIVTEMEAPLPGLPMLTRRLLARWHNGEPVALSAGARWIGVELFDLDRDPDEAVNVLGARELDRGGRRRVLDCVDRYRSDEARGELVQLAELLGCSGGPSR